MVGLGNPGPQYAATRHNLGFQVVDELASRWRALAWRESCQALVCEARAGAGGLPVVLAKPQTYMNRSGLAVRPLLERMAVDLSRLLVIHDDLDLPFGTLRVKASGGHGGHNGLRSLLEVLASGDFPRLKLGIGRPTGNDDVVGHVLSPFGPDEAPLVVPLVVRAADAAEAVVQSGTPQAMNRFNG